jgi:hypothetical protein
MKRDKIFYWITTSFVALSGLMAGIMYFGSPYIVKEFKNLGFPDYFRIELGIANILGSFAIIRPVKASLNNCLIINLYLCAEHQEPH